MKNSNAVEIVLADALKCASGDFCTPEDVLQAILSFDSVSSLLSMHGFNVEFMLQDLRLHYNQFAGVRPVRSCSAPAQFTPRMQRVLDRASTPHVDGSSEMLVWHLLYSLCTEPNCIAAEILRKHGLNPGTIEQVFYNAVLQIPSVADPLPDSPQFIVLPKQTTVNINGCYKAPWGLVYKLVGCDAQTNDLTFVDDAGNTKIQIRLCDICDWSEVK